MASQAAARTQEVLHSLAKVKMCIRDRPSPGHGNVLGLANATPDMLAALEQLSKAGYPVAQQVLGLSLIHI